MADSSAIEWTDATWNPVRGCSRISPGCGGPNHEGGCYAEKIAARFSGPGQPFEGYAERTPHGGRWTGKLALVADQLDQPLRWRKPRRIFVNSMSDLFHEKLPDEAIDQVFAVMALAPQHTFQILTKRADRMRAYLSDDKAVKRIIHQAFLLDQPDGAWLSADHQIAGHPILPLPNVWLGVSVEDQERADERIPELLATPAAVRFLSCEPLLGPLDLRDYLTGEEETGIDMSRPVGQRVGACTGWAPPVDWVIVGGESGGNARPMELRWLHDVVSQCQASDVPIFIKQLGAKPVCAGVRFSRYVESAGRDLPLSDRKGGDIREWPEYLRIREFPDVRQAP